MHVSYEEEDACVIESLADTLLAAQEETGGDLSAAATNFCAAYATYKKALEQERKAELQICSATKTWVCMCFTRADMEGELHRVMPERAKYLAKNGVHVRMAGSLKNSGGQVLLMCC